MQRTLKALLCGVGASLVVAPVAALSGWLYITQGHWNPAYIIVSVVVSDVLVGVTFFRLATERSKQHG